MGDGMKRYFVLILGVFFSSPMLAAEGVYLGGGVVGGWLDVSDINFRAQQVGYKLMGGWRVNKNFAVEATWQDFGNFSDSVSDVDVKVGVDGYTVEAIGILPTSADVELYGKLGYFDSDFKIAASGFDGNINDSDNGALLGFGMQAEAWPQIVVRLEFNWFDVEETFFGGALTAQYHFGKK